MIDVAAAVEYDALDACSERPLRDRLSDRLRGGDITAGLQAQRLFSRRSCSKRAAVRVVDDLGVNVIHTAEHRETRSIRCAAYFLANAAMNTLTYICSAFLCHILIAGCP